MVCIERVDHDVLVVVVVVVAVVILILSWHMHDMICMTCMHHINPEKESIPTKKYKTKQDNTRQDKSMQPSP